MAFIGSIVASIAGAIAEAVPAIAGVAEAAGGIGAGVAEAATGAGEAIGGAAEAASEFAPELANVAGRAGQIASRVGSYASRAGNILNKGQKLLGTAERKAGQIAQKGMGKARQGYSVLKSQGSKSFTEPRNEIVKGARGSKIFADSPTEGTYTNNGGVTQTGRGTGLRTVRGGNSLRQPLTQNPETMNVSSDLSTTDESQVGSTMRQGGNAATRNNTSLKTQFRNPLKRGSTNLNDTQSTQLSEGTNGSRFVNDSFFTRNARLERFGSSRMSNASSRLSNLERGASSRMSNGTRISLEGPERSVDPVDVLSDSAIRPQRVIQPIEEMDTPSTINNVSGNLEGNHENLSFGPRSVSRSGSSRSISNNLQRVEDTSGYNTRSTEFRGPTRTATRPSYQETAQADLRNSLDTIGEETQPKTPFESDPHGRTASLRSNSSIRTHESNPSFNLQEDTPNPSGDPSGGGQEYGTASEYPESSMNEPQIEEGIEEDSQPASKKGKWAKVKKHGKSLARDVGVAAAGGGAGAAAGNALGGKGDVNQNVYVGGGSAQSYYV